LLTVAGSIRRKGIIGGTVDTGLDAIPFVGALKAAVEVARGRDFIPDKVLRGDPRSSASVPDPRSSRVLVAGTDA
jgi:hypothetical protein